MVEKKKAIPSLGEDEYLKQIHRLQKTIEKYEQLAEKVRMAAVMDRSIYTGEEDPDWLSIDRDDYAGIMDVLSKIDLCKPWSRGIQPRITE